MKGKGIHVFALLRNTFLIQWNYLLFVSLPLYFVLDAGNHFWGWVPVNSALTVLAAVSASMVLLYVFFRIFLQAHEGLGLLIWVAVNYLFFGTIRDWLIANVNKPLFSPYKFYLIFLFLLTVLVMFVIRKLSSENARKFIQYLNLLFLILVVTELVKSAYNFSNKQVVPFYTAEVPLNKLSQSDYPDVYILQLDEYAGLYSLNNAYGIDNSRFVLDLQKRSFQVAQTPNSNYNGTPFSVLSLLNMGYVEGVNKTEIASAIAYSKSVEAVKQNKLIRFFESNQYKIINNSFFEMEKAESLNYLFLPIKQRLMLDKTFGSVLLNDLLCSVNSNAFHFFINDYPARIDNYNQEVIKRSFDATNNNESGKPVFMYSHFMMPHGPYLRDSNGGLKNIGAAHKELNRGLNINSYMEYLQYCNKVSLQMIDTILAKKPNSIIVLLSDHGLRNSTKGNRKYSEFNNFVAVYAPDKTNLQLPDSLCTVNVFRLLLNEYFDQKLPLLNNKMINVNMGLAE